MRAQLLPPTPATRRWLLGAALALLASVSACQSTAPQLATTHPTASETHMSWKTVCVGRVLMQFPNQGKADWSQAFHGEDFKRLPTPLSLDQFWRGVETIKGNYEAQKHRQHSSRLAHFERVNDKLGIVIGYDNKNVLTGPAVRAFTWLDAEHAYATVNGIAFTDEIPPTPALFADTITRYTQAAQNIEPLTEGQVPSGPGFCIDGAVVRGDTGIGANATYRVEFLHGSTFGLGYAENMSRVEVYSEFGELKWLEREADARAKAGNGYKEFSVLRRQERTIDGLKGQEYIVRRVNPEGVKFYEFAWGVRGANEGGIIRPGFSAIMQTPTTTVETATGKPYPPLPAEDRLIALWDHALSTFKVRPGSMPPGQAIEAFNDDDGLTPWREPK